jgi:hypothetical protein
MEFKTYFRASSYAMIAVAMLALVFAGGLSPLLAVAFAAVMVVSWKLEGTRWQLSERVGLLVVLLSVPLFYIDWKLIGPLLESSSPGLGVAGAGASIGALAHLILFLSAVKLLQVKADRDWVFLYLISFFEVLLAAGLSLSPIFLVSLTAYLICSLSTVIAFEMHKAGRGLKTAETRLLVAPDAKVFKRLARHGAHRSHIEVRRLPLVAVVLLLLIVVLGLPLFLVAPRASSASLTRGGGAGRNLVGFSESVTLGEIGSLKRNNEIVMRVRLEDSTTARTHEFRWRGVALDEFTGRGWKKSAEARRSKQTSNDRGFYQIGTTEALPRLTTQTIFLEPMDTAVVFAAPRAVALQGPFPFIRIDNEGTMQSRHHEVDRLIYKAFSDTTEPGPDVLRADVTPYPVTIARYLQLPAALDPRISDLARAMRANVPTHNPYDVAKAIETHLRTDYGYTLEMKASGSDPLSDFLFNVREGHCEYFSTAMVVMLRTQAIPARVVNGFLSGEYNDAAGAYTVHQSDAHSWVEVYFAGTNSWITFDPTPASGRAEPTRTGLAAYLGKYSEALELFWLQYVVGYDKQEQHSLATAVNGRLFTARRVLVAAMERLKQLAEWRLVLFVGVTLVLGGLLLWRIKRFGRRGRAGIRYERDEAGTSAVEFYERLITLLAARGLKRDVNQTPLEFATGLGLSEVMSVTQAYNRVRFGGEELSVVEQRQLEAALDSLKGDS